MDPNRYATATEAALLREHIAIEESERARDYARLATVRTALHDAEEQLRLAQAAASSARAIVAQIEARDALREDGLRAARGLLHPIRRVPGDVLALVFEALLDVDEPSATFVVSSVCRHWRQTALDIPTLWSYIEVPYLGPGDPVKPWTTYLDVVLRRSKQAPLVIAICLAENKKINRILLEAVLSASHRWTSLKIDVGIMEHLELAQRLMGFVDAPVLEKLALYIPTPTPLQLFDGWASRPPLPALKEFKLRDRTDDPRHINVDFSALASRMPNLRKASIGVTVKGNQTGSVNFLQLRSLALTSEVLQAIRHTLRCPVLQQLGFESFAQLHNLDPFLNSCGARTTLRKLQLRDIRIDAAFRDTLRLLENLQELHIYGCLVYDDFLRALSAPEPESNSWLVPRLSLIRVSCDGGWSEADVECNEQVMQEVVRSREQSSKAAMPGAPCALQAHVTLDY